MRACFVCVCSRVPSLQTRTGTARRSGADFGTFATPVCVQMMCGAFGSAQKLASAVA
eukprot:COSAG03_NODE_13624_length_495_cov_0.603535_1_plen_56_part_10